MSRAERSRKRRSNHLFKFLLVLVICGIGFGFVADPDAHKGKNKNRRRLVTAGMKDCLKSHLSSDFQKNHADIKNTVHEGDTVSQSIQNTKGLLKSISFRDYNQVYTAYEECAD